MSDDQSPASDNPPLVLNPDGSCTRFISFPCSPPTPDHDSDTPALSKDVTINDTNKTGVRIYLPKETLITPVGKLPLIIYYHGGGFVLMSASSTQVHNFCNQLAAHLHAVVVSVDYRLAPEHRLPAAYDDGMEALHWIQSSKDPWLTESVDFSNCYLMGTSAGANLAYHVAVRASLQLHDLEPLKIKGVILHHMFIGGVERTGAEIRLADAGMLTLSRCDAMWDLSLPVGASREHEYCNPVVGGGLDDVMSRMKEVGWRVMVTGCYGDLLIDRQLGFAKMLELKGVENECFLGEGYHGIELDDELKAKELFDVILNFMTLNNVHKD
ncbi:hypothetical protein L6452_05136 [Arctium lappa]|uniref:Uncharacterized protein n=1 Tax=Arctium lappa TaxID=4217 RepID=A0ACB9EG02_ARCLA|nr:hypothetical protein L6452_05136 [Arctium lappa]